ncbi:dihydropteroate synthase [Pseudomonadales bacterium]|nr:dihydropteroate synthase [Pseudomonadales bacterium]MDA8954315.1 dihydropteroate synthase [Pseudomonadales bacterium]MDB2595902.1 dihydropteroate synthase [Pseudomonadales bacterium]MDB9757362.1 dihydropteroate synthase [Pseudomonadales bacterium]MDC1322306.1 dihydropteroate synthase [Pseudomonadales bacterium]
MTTPRFLRCAEKQLDLQHPQVMGVLNITPDSFSDGGNLFDDAQIPLDKILVNAQRMIDEGASVLDIGGESSRPGAQAVSVAEEIRRVLPVVEALKELDCIISVDTRNGETAKATINAGAHMINDISAGADSGVMTAVANSDVAYALMHMQGMPETMQNNPRYEQVVTEVAQFLRRKYQNCLSQGIAAERMLVDPGFGFGKSLQHNLQLLAHIEALRVDDCPILVGISRKSMLGQITGRDVQDRLAASVAAAVLAVQNGADLVRAHDVKETVDGLKVWLSLSAAT